MVHMFPFDHFKEQIQVCTSLEELEKVRLLLFGKAGLVTQELKSLGRLDPIERKEYGQRINTCREELQSCLLQKKHCLQEQEKGLRLKSEVIDVTLAPSAMPFGKLHPLTLVIQEISRYFLGLGFQSRDGMEIEDEYHNFDGLNVPTYHPARQSQDTFYLQDHPYLLRTHTSCVEIRTLQKEPPPLRIISCGRVYRNDALDATHTPLFHQFEGFVVEEGITMAHLKGILFDFCRFFFDRKDLKLRFRPSFFPFTEPSGEIDIAYKKEGDSITLGEGEQWMEILGCGMLHPRVFELCGRDPKKHVGFAFGMGVERLLMLKYGISDIRLLYENDARFLNHFGGFA